MSNDVDIQKYSYEEAYQSTLKYFDGDELATKVFIDKYALTNNEGEILEKDPADMHHRLAKEFARIEKSKFKEPLSEDEIFGLFDHFRYIVPQGSPMYGIGNNYSIQSLGNCFALGEHPYDSYGGICYTDEMLVQLSKRRCGVGICLNNLRPKGMVTHNSAKTTDGIAVFVKRFGNSTREVAQCLHEKSLILTKSGLKYIKDVIPKNDYVWTKKGWVLVINKYNNGKKHTKKLTTKLGYILKATNKHIISTCNNGSIIEKHICNINVNDDVVLLLGTQTHNANVDLITNEYNPKPCTSHYNNINLPRKLNDDLAYLLGYSYGDGHFTYDKHGEKQALCLSCNDSILINRLIKIIKEQLNYDAKIVQGSGNVQVIKIYSKNFCNFLSNNQLAKEKSNHINFPDRILFAPSNIQLSFFAGYFDADGNVFKNKSMGVSSCSFKFIKQCQIMLFSNGIISNVQSLDRSYIKTKNESTQYRLNIIGRYSKNIARKYINSTKIQKNIYELHNDYILTPYNYKSENLRNINITTYNFIPTNSKRFLSIGALNRLKQIGLYTNELLIKDRVISIENDEYIDTYDLELQNECLFWCDGFYVHNSGRRGGSLQGLSIHHPEIETFIDIKKDDKNQVTASNLSVIFTDEFMNRLIKNKRYEQRWPIENKPPIITNTIDAKIVWDKFIFASWKSAEPSALYIDNARNYSLSHCYGSIDNRFKDITPNVCGEVWMGMDSCRLMLLNTLSYIDNPYTTKAKLNYKKFSKHIEIAQRLLDDMIDLEIEKINIILDKINKDPEPDYIKRTEKNLWTEFLEIAKLGRRTGLGLTAIGDALAALNIKYGSKESIKELNKIFKTLGVHSLISSCNLAKELGTFPLYNPEVEKGNKYLARLFQASKELEQLHNKYGRRNISLTTMSPAGTVSVMTQTTSGIEPVFLLEYTRKYKTNQNGDYIDGVGDNWKEFKVQHKGLQKWMEINNCTDITQSPYYHATAKDINWKDSIKIQSVCQKWISHSISKTCNLPATTTKEEVSEIFLEAWKQGCKGFTIYREGCRDGVLLDNSESQSIVSQQAQQALPRPKKIPCDVHHVSVKGVSYFVLVGIFNDRPYEIFAAKNNGLVKHSFKAGEIVKKRKGFYKAVFDDDNEIAPIMASSTDVEETVTRLASTCLRANVDLNLLTVQLEKVGGENAEMHSFAKVLARVLKKYIKDGTAIDGEVCPDCGGKLIRKDGCWGCEQCLYTKCL
jgi:ribonucleoside-diphosphate reductase alpha chain